ncbi:MAG: hypothetical protein VKJ64_06915, partial [Leptolyngbyaceae bacterium]|nr:hypothetical protein [Leptolyngbyaceae bacterium]
ECMNKALNTEIEAIAPQESESFTDSEDTLLDEYDFTQGSRNKYAHRYRQSQQDILPGVHFVTDAIGNKIGVLLDIQMHHALWNAQTKDTLINEFTFLTQKLIL